MRTAVDRLRGAGHGCRSRPCFMPRQLRRSRGVGSRTAGALQYVLDKAVAGGGGTGRLIAAVLQHGGGGLAEEGAGAG
jgi:hypothetical protein